MKKESTNETIEKAQKEMRESYVNGATGVVVSGLVWLTSAVVLHYFSTKNGTLTLLVGGVLIHPLSTAINKILGAKAFHSKNNALGTLAMEGTLFMIMTIPLAYGLSLTKPEWFFQGMLMIIGGRYLTFRTVYGNKLYYVMGCSLAIAACLSFTWQSTSLTTVLAGSFIEICFGILFFFNHYGIKKAQSNALAS